MPIIVQSNIAFAISRIEFIEEYNKLKGEKGIISEELTISGFDITLSILAITNLYIKREEEVMADKFNKTLYAFNYLDKEAQNITLELLVFFSKFYYSIEIKSNNNLQLINDYLLPTYEIRF